MSMAKDVPNQLYYGDNLEVLRLHIPDDSVDLVYLDPPFNSNADYNLLFSEEDGTRAAAQIKAFTDTWRWDQAAAAAFQEVVEQGGNTSETMAAFQRMLGDSNMLAYLAMMAPRLIELKRVLKETGSIFLHCDPTASHYLKVLLDAIFGPKNFRNEIVWNYHGPASPKIKQFPRKHDIIFWYSMSDEWTFNRDAIRVPHAEKTQENFQEGNIGSGFIEDETLGDDDVLHKDGKVVEDWWIMAIAPRSTKEYLGYPTQKPLKLMRRIINAASNPGDVVLDPFCGCGTTVAAAEELKRTWIGIDVTYLAVALMKARLNALNTNNYTVEYEVKGEPVSIEDAERLAKEDRYQFQWWALGQVGARPVDEKKGADKGIDGRMYFFDEGSKSKQVILSVKSGKVQVRDIRELKAVVEREDAQIGVFLTLKPPTAPMLKEAATAGFYKSPLTGEKYPKIQILTVEDLFDDRQIKKPYFSGNPDEMQTKRSAKKEEKINKAQLTLGEEIEEE